MTEVQSKWRDRTRGGYPVRIYNEDANILHHIHGAMACSEHGQMNCASWRADGRYFTTDGPYDLMPIKKKKRVYKTLNEIALDYGFSWNPFDIVVHGKDNTHYKAASYLIGSDRDVAVYASDEWPEIFTKEVDDNDTGR